MICLQKRPAPALLVVTAGGYAADTTLLTVNPQWYSGVLQIMGDWFVGELQVQHCDVSCICCDT